MTRPSFFIVIISLTLGLLSACGSNAPVAKTASTGDPASTDKTAIKEAKASTPKTSFDTAKPTSYSEYKRWRSENDPASEAYSEYKEWEINYRRWKARQENN